MLYAMQSDFIPSDTDNRKVYYLKKRERFNELKVNSDENINIEKAALMIFLNKTCFNGLFRVNKKGLFNVPMGASKLEIDCIKSISDLSAFWHAYQGVCEKILNLYGRNIGVHLFPAVPVSAAFEIGRRYMSNTYPKINIYDECDGFFETLILGGKLITEREKMLNNYLLRIAITVSIKKHNYIDTIAKK